jgi:hypothetical protein
LGDLTAGEFTSLAEQGGGGFGPGDGHPLEGERLGEPGPFGDIPDPEVAAEFVAQLGDDLQDDSCPVEVRSLGRTILRWRDQIAAWHQARFTNAPTEAANNLIKRVKRVAFGFTRFRNYRVRVLLYAGRPNWQLLATVQSR